MMRSIRTLSLRTPRSGLTLLEVILASALSLVLLGAVYASLTQSWRLNVQGKIELERNQIARSVLRQMELDIRATMFSALAASTDTSSSSSSSSGTTSSSGIGNASTGSSSSSGSSGSSSSSSSSTSTSGTTEDAWTGSLGIRGTSTELWIDLSHVNRQIEFQSTAVRVSDLQTVAYFLSNSAAVASSAMMSGSAGSPIRSQDNDGIGLVRSQGDRSILRALNSSSTASSSSSSSSSFSSIGTGSAAGSSEVLPGPMQMLAPEINYLQFRYFDGLSWYTEWDSSSSSALPRAIEVTFTFEPAPKMTGFLMSPAIASGTDMYRMVIPVPVSNPMPPEETY